MERFSPKIEIINHFDNLINRIDIDIDSSIENYNDQELISEILLSSEKNRLDLKKRLFDYNVKFFDTFDSSKQLYLNSWPESMKVIDYLKQIRMKTIEELKNSQEEAIEYYKLNSQRFKSEQTKEKNIKELKSELFTEKFYFQVNFNQSENLLWPFNVFTFVTDFYISQSNIDSLEKLVNEEKEPFGLDPVFDDKMVLTGLLFKCFIENFYNFPAHVIYVCKQDVLNIESIIFTHQFSRVNLISSSTIDLSKLVNLDIIDRKSEYRRESVKIYLEGLCSLKKLQLAAFTNKVDFSIKNLPSLANFSFYSFCTIDQNFVTKLLDQVPYIQQLCLYSNVSYLNLDNFANLRVLEIGGGINSNFNFELFKNLCNQLENVKIGLRNIDENTLVKLFDGYNFPYLRDFTIWNLNIKRLTKEFINRLPKPRNKLNLYKCEIKVIENDSFSNMQQLTWLNLSRNRIELIEKNAFSNLKNLETLDLSVTNFDRKFIGLSESVEVKIENKRFRN